MHARLLLIAAMSATGLCASWSQAHMYRFSSSDRGAWLGVMVQDVTKNLKDKKDLTVAKGAYVSEVIEDSPAEKAKIREGDVIVKFEGRDIDDGEDLTTAVRNAKPRTEVKIDIVRKADHLTLTATLARDQRSYAYSFRMPRMPRMPKPGRAGVHLFSSSADLNGLEVQDLNRQLADYFEVPDRHGVLVTSVEKSSTADQAGFKAGDVIVKFGGSEVRGVDDLSEAIDDMKKSDDVPCNVVRKGKPLTLKWHVEPNDDGDWEDDDDTSWNSVAPEGHRLPESLRDHHDFDKLKENLERMQLEFKARFHDVKTRLSEAITLLMQSIIHA